MTALNYKPCSSNINSLLFSDVSKATLYPTHTALCVQHISQVFETSLSFRLSPFAKGFEWKCWTVGPRLLSSMLTWGIFFLCRYTTQLSCVCWFVHLNLVCCAGGQASRSFSSWNLSHQTWLYHCTGPSLVQLAATLLSKMDATSPFKELWLDITSDPWQRELYALPCYKLKKSQFSTSSLADPENMPNLWNCITCLFWDF